MHTNMDTLRWTTYDLELMPNDGHQYEIIDGELYVSKQPDWQHQLVCSQLLFLLQTWNNQNHAGVANFAPGLIFTDDTAVMPDVVWISHARLRTALHADGKLHATPELVIEVLSPGAENARRDREVKLKLYSRRGALEYWVVDWQQHRIELYRRSDGVLVLEKTLDEMDTLHTPLLPGFSCKVSQIFISF
jgi:Uma2 family endonuclease